MFIKRHIEIVLKKMLSQFKVVLVTGPRQVGKTTLLRNSLASDWDYVTFDNLSEVELAKEDVTLFFKNHHLPLMIDEVQYAQDIFRHIKFIVDQKTERGLICLTGSQTFHLMKNVSETLAGRIGILELRALSLREIYDVKFYEPFLPDRQYLERRQQENINYEDVWEDIFRGGMPELTNKNYDWQLFYSSYAKTYIERDVRDVLAIKDISLFRKFMVALASRTGTLFVASDVASALGVSLKTVQEWTSILEASGIIFLLQPYSNNILKRTIKTPKIFLWIRLLCVLLSAGTTQKSLKTER